MQFLSRRSLFHSDATDVSRCGICNEFGHGQLECGNRAKTSSLRQYDNERMPINVRCTVDGCTAASTHTLAAHHTVWDPVTAVPSPPNAKTCPTCRRTDQTYESVVYTDADCIVCYTRAPVVVFSDCRHANVCLTCFEQL